MDRGLIDGPDRPERSAATTGGESGQPSGKGLGTVAWVLLICAGVALIAGLLFGGLKAADNFHRHIHQRWLQEQQRQRHEQRPAPSRGRAER